MSRSAELVRYENLYPFEVERAMRSEMPGVTILRSPFDDKNKWTCSEVYEQNDGVFCLFGSNRGLLMLTKLGDCNEFSIVVTKEAYPSQTGIKKLRLLKDQLVSTVGRKAVRVWFRSTLELAAKSFAHYSFATDVIFNPFKDSLVTTGLSEVVELCVDTGDVRKTDTTGRRGGSIYQSVDLNEDYIFIFCLGVHCLLLYSHELECMRKIKSPMPQPDSFRGKVTSNHYIVTGYTQHLATFDLNTMKFEDKYMIRGLADYCCDVKVLSENRALFAFKWCLVLFDLGSWEIVWKFKWAHTSCYQNLSVLGNEVIVCIGDARMLARIDLSSIEDMESETDIHSLDSLYLSLGKRVSCLNRSLIVCGGVPAFFFLNPLGLS